MVAIMQPYFMPYLGYVQLMHLVDTFVVYDDVNYINRGWINRNNVLVNGNKTMLTVPLQGASQNKKINEIGISGDPKWRKKMLRSVEMSYKKATYFEQAFALFSQSISSDEKQLAVFLKDSLISLAEYLDLDVNIISSTDRFNNEDLKKGDRLMDICIQLGDMEYINPIGGQEIYTKEQFMEKGVAIKFLEMIPKPYPQLGNSEFVGYLSILDVLMNNSPEFIREELLGEYKLY